MQFLVVLALAIALVAVLFAIQNPAFVTVNFFIWAIEERLALVLLLTLAAGVAVGLLVSIPTLIKRSMQVSRHRRELEDLRWQFQEKDAEISSHQQAKETIRLQQRELLNALGATEPTTGLLQAGYAAPALAYLLQRMTENSVRYSSVAVFLVEAGSIEVDTALETALPTPLLRATAHRIEQTVPPSSWLYHNGQGRFCCLTSGLDTQMASEYGETLRLALVEKPLALPDASLMPVNVSIGGVIALPNQSVSSSALLQQAEEALEHAKRRGRNRFRLVEAKE